MHSGIETSGHNGQGGLNFEWSYSGISLYIHMFLKTGHSFCRQMLFIWRLLCFILSSSKFNMNFEFYQGRVNELWPLFTGWSLFGDDI